MAGLFWKSLAKVSAVMSSLEKLAPLVVISIAHQIFRQIFDHLKSIAERLGFSGCYTQHFLSSCNQAAIARFQVPYLVYYGDWIARSVNNRYCRKVSGPRNFFNFSHIKNAFS